MKERLDGARFRLINESLYKSDSHDAHRMMQEDPRVFEQYHVGFRHQVLSWPTNPVDQYITKFASYPERTLIADLGCGDAALAKGLAPEGISVLSYDLVSDNEYVVEADICKSIPLPGSEGTEGEQSLGEGQVADAVVCALSLMGTNWIQCLREAWRILKPSGQLHIAEVTSRFSDVEQFVSVVGSIGFHLKTKDTSNTHFILFEFTKVSRLCLSEKEWTKLIAKGSLLKPCEYKRR
ncbi:methyltransferase-domain-containing protein [Crepidotus variabilis]|uniref:Ribosomal RNA-processing protein 8 n=1 Tax=Crepidotus variabilis TaxID=179855 RepID=A0A9P6ESQ5_9AGAR|nr:methyltransferase-domain-containing protein [Crepidotus variabilis]